MVQYLMLFSKYLRGIDNPCSAPPGDLANTTKVAFKALLLSFKH